uniref:Uncharacterized protein n=1 Tax=Panagrolaimus superbus TaxID=310955 RepID=A0A914Z5S8_9BILA
MLIEEILRDVLRNLGNSTPSSTTTAPSDENNSKKDSENDSNTLAKFMVSGREPLDVAFKFFKSVKAAVLNEDSIELITDKDESAKVQFNDVISIKAVMEILQKGIKKLECTKFNEEFVPFWDSMKSNVKELELSDFNFDNKKYIEVVKNMDSLDKAIIELDIYCIGFMEGISLTCNELVLKGEAFDQIENGEDLKIKLPSVKKLTVAGRYVGWGPTDMSLESLIKNLKAICPVLEELNLLIDDDNVDDEVPQTFIELISKPKIDEKINLKVVFNFTLNESSWQKSKFHKELQKHPDIEMIGAKDGSKSKIKAGEKKLIEFNLSSEMTEDDDEEKEEEEEEDSEPASKKIKT